jgi:uncharacterized protein YerC
MFVSVSCQIRCAALRHTSAYVSIREHTSAYLEALANVREAVKYIREHTRAYESIRQHTSAYLEALANVREAVKYDALPYDIHQP